MRDSIIVMLGMLFLSGPRPDDPSPTQRKPAATQAGDPGVCLSRLAYLEARLDRLENPARHQLKSSVDGRTEIFKTPEGCMMWVEYNQVYFQGCNVHIVNSSGPEGAIDQGDGLGNLIVGKNACPPANPNCRQYHPGFTQPGEPEDSDRMGSHNIIVGDGHGWSEAAVNSVVFGRDNFIKGLDSGILGGRENVVTGERNTIVSGKKNKVVSPATDSTITGGQQGTISNGQFAAIVGGKGNTISSRYASILGGDGNRAASDYAAVVGGGGNSAQGLGSVIISGTSNTASGDHSLVLGGERNSAGGRYASILNGYANSALGKYSLVSTGSLNVAKGDFSYIATGGGGKCFTWQGLTVCDFHWGNLAEGAYSSIFGGYRNQAKGTHASVLSGSSNSALGHAAVVVGGGGSGITIPNYSPPSIGNSAVGSHSVVVGGMENRSYGPYSAILAGGNNETHGEGAVVAGGGGILSHQEGITSNPGNIAYGRFSLVAGGEYNVAGNAMVLGPQTTLLQGDNAVVVGGMENQAAATRSCAVGGRGNRLFHPIAEFGSAFGGVGNQVSGPFSVVVGGKYNVADGHAVVVGGGMLNWAYDDVSVIFGGMFNVAGVPALDPIDVTYPLLMDIDAGVVGERAGISIFGGYHNRAYEKLGTITGGADNVVGSVENSEDFCLFCSDCPGEGTVQFFQPLSSPLVPRDCTSCQWDCRSSTSHTTGATIAGGYSNHLGASPAQGYLYYMWIAGEADLNYYYPGCSNADCY